MKSGMGYVLSQKSSSVRKLNKVVSWDFFPQVMVEAQHPRPVSNIPFQQMQCGVLPGTIKQSKACV
jgi:hypothetical protein